MSIEAVKNLAVIQVIKTSANWGFFVQILMILTGREAKFVGSTDHLVLEVWLPNAWYGREHE